ncbi:tumor necrosis factor alpha-induced protein 2 [Sorex araneus]|uniref:tumor necrosis factor alpha-induced protein 2 n=1 Tax=Sorex araneus TaxID=42254 RepID=UPI00243367F4|nr:tumor necrosis factor alpha-induced protein 2 [Sorex araneus]
MARSCDAAASEHGEGAFVGQRGSRRWGGQRPGIPGPARAGGRGFSAGAGTAGAGSVRDYLWRRGRRRGHGGGDKLGMLKMTTYFQGLPGALDLPERAPEVRAEAFPAEAASEDLGAAPEAEGDLAQDKDEASRKEKKAKGLSTLFNVFGKGRKKKGQPRAAEAPPGRTPAVEELKAALEQGRLEAAGPLLALERELRAAAAAGGASAEELVRRQSKVEALYVLLRDQVLAVLRRPLDVAPARLRQALAVLAEQEREDRRAEAEPGPPALEATRPRGWLRLWRRDVAREAEERLGREPAADAQAASAGGSEAERVFLHMGRATKDALEAAVARLKPLFPAEFQVVAVYAESYHQHFAAHVAAMAQFELCERDTYTLLLWVRNLYPNDILNSPMLASELQGVKLGSLLPPRQVQILEATFLANEVANVRVLMARALEVESPRWAKDIAPPCLDGHCHSELAIDIMQILSQGQAKAKSITPDLSSQIKPLLLSELTMFLRSYQRTFDEFLESCKQLRNYRANVMANINNCQLFRTTLEQKWQTQQNLQKLHLGPLSELKSHGFDVLLQDLFGDLQPRFKRLLPSRQRVSMETLEEIISRVGAALPEFSGLHASLREELLEEVHLHLVKEFILGLTRRRLVLKTAEQQLDLAAQIQASASLIQAFCTQHGSPATWLQQALLTLAEILRLQDPNAIKIAVATYATWYPDFSKAHLSAILAIKGNLSSSDAKSIRSILDVSVGVQEPSKPLFSLIKVG